MDHLEDYLHPEIRESTVGPPNYMSSSYSYIEMTFSAPCFSLNMYDFFTGMESNLVRNILKMGKKYTHLRYNFELKLAVIRDISLGDKYAYLLVHDKYHTPRSSYVNEYSDSDDITTHVRSLIEEIKMEVGRCISEPWEIREVLNMTVYLETLKIF